MDSSQRTKVLRILDAEGNRAAEAARVLEAYCRFALDDRHLTERCKQLRHELAAALAEIPATGRLEARDTRRDVGTSLTSDTEQRRADTDQVLSANAKRLEQALRSLEEYSKILLPDAAARFKSLRYTVYTLERAAAITSRSHQQLPEPSLYVLIDGGPSNDVLAARVRELVQAGVHLLQLRDKELDDRHTLERARLLRDLTRDSNTLFIVNDRPDIAVLSSADGVHLGQNELSVKDARSIVGPDRLIGVSTHTLAQARQAVLDGASYIGVGPTFPSPTKSFDHFPGLDLLRAVAAEVALPAFAIGGISEDNVEQVVAAGFRRIAVRSAVTDAARPTAAIGRLLAKLRAPPPP
jgi:thiamine-phosphate pyrophosphorylase